MSDILAKIESCFQLVEVNYSAGIWSAECSDGKDDYITDDHESVEDAVAQLYQLVKHLMKPDDYQFDDEVPF